MILKKILTEDQKTRLVSLAEKLVDQNTSRTLITPKQSKEGFWFGGGNMIESKSGELYLVGRFRNEGDSRTGVNAGERGMELAVFRSSDLGENFTHLFSFSKGDLDLPEHPVLSIEGSCLFQGDRGIELFVSSEKGNIVYPAGFEAYQKPGTGIWSIDCIRADTVENLPDGKIEPVLNSNDPRFLHVKDPVVFKGPAGSTMMVFCTHPYSWTSSNSAICARLVGKQEGTPDYTFFPRGTTWDVAVSRITGVLPVPATGLFSENLQYYLVFYDGAECVRQLEENPLGVRRPRGYSCEEIGGLAVGLGSELRELERLSPYQPLFVSPFGTGSSRYVDVMMSEKGLYAIWQQSQPDRSQPLVMNFLSNREVEEIIG